MTESPDWVPWQARWMETVQAMAESNEVIIEETEEKAQTTTVSSVPNTSQPADLSSRKKRLDGLSFVNLLA